MKCPCCNDEATYLNNSKTKFYKIHRYYHCIPCDMKFKTTESLDFTSLPYEVRETFLETGIRTKRK